MSISPTWLTTFLHQWLQQYESYIANFIDIIITLLIGNWHPQGIKKVYRDFSLKLLESLPMNDIVFLELLKDHDLFSGDLKEQVQARATRREKAVWFLDNAIDRPLSIDNFEPLCKLLTVMTDEIHLNNDCLKQLAMRIKEELEKETSIITMSETARGYYILRNDA